MKSDKRYNKSLTATRLKEVLSYDKDTGEFIWLARTNKYAPITVGKVAGSLHKTGYLQIQVDGESYKCHRLAWLYVNDVWPEGDIDHINGLRSDNRIENLREAYDKNSCNTSIRVDNSTGVKGVSFHKGIGKYTARISSNGVMYNLGVFDSIEQATTVVRDKRVDLHKEYTNHGS